MEAFALGVTLWVMLFRKHPRDKRLLDFAENKSESITKAHKSLLKVLLVEDPRSRFSVRKVLQLLARFNDNVRDMIEAL